MRDDWVEIELGEVCNVLSGTGFPKKFQGRKEGKYPFYKVGDISRNVQSNNRYLPLCDNYINDEILKNIKGKIIPKNSVVFAKIGEALKLNRRAITNCACLIDNNVVGLKANQDFVADLFLYYFFVQIKLEHFSRATTVPSVRKSDLEKIAFCLAPLPEQRAIVAKIEQLFSDLDDGVANLKTARSKLDIYRQSVLKKAFEGELTKEWRLQQGEPCETDDKNGGKLPEGWKKVRLGDVCEKASKIKRKEMPLDSSFLYLDIGGIDNKTNRIIGHKQYTWSEAPSRAQQIVQVGDILFSTVRTYLKNIAQVSNAKYEDQIASSGFTIIRGMKEVLNPKYAYYMSIFEGFLQPLNEMQTGTSYPAVRDKDVFSQKIPLAPLPEQHAIVSAIEERLSVCDKLAETIDQSLEKAEVLRQGILKRAFAGELLSSAELDACRQEPDWEPAAKLLERIKREK